MDQSELRKRMSDPKAREEAENKLSGLPDMKKIQVPDFATATQPLSVEEQEKVREEVRKRREFAEWAGKMRVDIETKFREAVALIDPEIAEMESDTEELELSPTLRRRLATLKADRKRLEKERDEALAKIEVEDEGLRKHTEFAMFLAEIRDAKAEEEEAEKFLAKATARKRIRLTDRKTGTNLLFWKDKVYEPSPDSTGKVTPATVGLMNELRKLVKAAKDAAEAARQKAYDENVAEMKAEGEKITLSQLSTVNPHPVGPVYGQLPAREEKFRDGRIYHERESHLLTKSDGRVIRPAKAVGQLANFFADLKARGISISVREFRERRLLTENGTRLPEDTYRLKLRFLNILLAALHIETASRPATAPSTPPPTTALTTVTESPPTTEATN